MLMDNPLLSHEIKEQISNAISEYLEKTFPSGTEIHMNNARAEITQKVSNIIEGFVGPSNVPTVIVNFYDDGTWDIVLTDWPEKGLLN